MRRISAVYTEWTAEWLPHIATVGQAEGALELILGNRRYSEFWEQTCQRIDKQCCTMVFDEGIYTIAYPTYSEKSTPTSLENESSDDLRTSPSQDKDSRMETRKWGWLLDVLTGATVITFIAVVEYGVLPNIQGGFYCGDPSISHKFQGDSVSTVLLLSVTVVAPLIVMWIVESANCTTDAYNMSNAFKRRMVTGMKIMWRWYREYLVGVLVVLFLTDVAKTLVGEPRPHFLDTCQPDMAANCTPGEYVQTFHCTGVTYSQYFMKDSTKSFPSGHTSISVFTAIFMIWFIQQRVSPNISYLLIPYMQCICLVWTMVCGFTRITDHRHHWWDVLAGAFLGVAAAAFTVKQFCRGFNPTMCKVAPQYPARAGNTGSSSQENGHVPNGNRNHSVRRLLSTSSSFASSEDKELSEVPAV